MVWVGHRGWYCLVYMHSCHGANYSIFLIYSDIGACDDDYDCIFFVV